MGSGVSIKNNQISCPEGYSEDKFNKILKLFDKLDENGDQVAETGELASIAKLHISNKINKVTKLLENRETIHSQKMEMYNNQKNMEIKKIELEWNQKITSYQNSFSRDHEKFKAELSEYENMDDKKKQEEFIKVVVGKDNKIDFWKFFEYVKNKTKDIDNIDFN